VGVGAGGVAEPHPELRVGGGRKTGLSSMATPERSSRKGRRVLGDGGGGEGSGGDRSWPCTPGHGRSLAALWEWRTGDGGLSLSFSCRRRRELWRRWRFRRSLFRIGASGKAFGGRLKCEPLSGSAGDNFEAGFYFFIYGLILGACWLEMLLQILKL
jgi:hypothetical protein